MAVMSAVLPTVATIVGDVCGRAGDKRRNLALVVFAPGKIGDNVPADLLPPFQREAPLVCRANGIMRCDCFPPPPLLVRASSSWSRDT